MLGDGRSASTIIPRRWPIDEVRPQVNAIIGQTVPRRNTRMARTAREAAIRDRTCAFTRRRSPGFCAAPRWWGSRCRPPRSRREQV